MKLKRQIVSGMKSGRAAARLPADSKLRHATSTQRARLQNAEYFRTLVENTTEGIAVVLPDGIIRYHNPSLLSMLGYSAQELLVADFLDLVHPDDLNQMRAALESAENHLARSMVLEFRMRHKDRRWRIMECHLTNLLGNSSLRGLVLSLRDITERTLAEREINENRQQLRSLAMALTMAEEKERRQLATELHDSIGQALALANLKLGALLSPSTSEEQAGRIGEVREMIRDMIKTTRSLTFNLSPPILYSVGFEAAVEWLGKRIRDEHGIDFKIHTFGAARPMDENLRILLFHVVRELLFNIVKHAQAKSVKVFISSGEDSINVVIEDDGVGFDTGILLCRRADAEGFGLFSIHERLNHVGGAFAIQSADGQGTTVSVSVPFSTGGGSEHEGQNSSGG